MSLKKDDVDLEITEVEDTCSRPTVRRTSTASIPAGLLLTPELLEQLYFASKGKHAENHHTPSRFANPSALGFMGFSIADVTFAMILMGWGGATSNSLSSVAGIFFFTGPLLLLLSTIFEWAMNNFFSMMVCGFFAVFWFSFGFLQLPTMGIAASFSASGTNAAEGAISVGYTAGIGLYLAALGTALFTIWVYTLRMNVVITLIMGVATAGVYTLSAAYFTLGMGDFTKATNLQHAGGAMLFAVGLLGWYMTVVIMNGEMGMPVSLPVGDLSHLWKRRNADLEHGDKQA